MSVNDLAKKWLKWCKQVPGNSWGPQVKECASDLDRIAQNAWHPVSDPPTEEDANPDGKVMLWVPGVTDPCTCPWDEANIMLWAPMVQWARTRDVILLPPEDKYCHQFVLDEEA